MSDYAVASMFCVFCLAMFGAITVASFAESKQTNQPGGCPIDTACLEVKKVRKSDSSNDLYYRLCAKEKGKDERCTRFVKAEVDG